MPSWIRKLQQSLMFKVILAAGVTMLIGISTWAYLSIRHYRITSIENMTNDVDRLSNTIRLGTHYAMMLDSREDIRQTIHNVTRQPGIENIRIYNKLGLVMFSNDNQEVGMPTDIKETACYVCHKMEPPETILEIEERTRIYEADAGHRKMGIIIPIYNESSCSGGPCHVHPADKVVLGLLDMVVSRAAEQGVVIVAADKRIVGIAAVQPIVAGVAVQIVVVIALTEVAPENWTRG